MRTERGQSSHQCGGKTAHKSRTKARRHADRLPGLEVYRCPYCRAYHVGGNPDMARVIVPRHSERDNRHERRVARQRGYGEEVGVVESPVEDTP